MLTGLISLLDWVMGERHAEVGPNLQSTAAQQSASAPIPQYLESGLVIRSHSKQIEKQIADCFHLVLPRSEGSLMQRPKLRCLSLRPDYSASKRPGLSYRSDKLSFDSSHSGQHSPLPFENQYIACKAGSLSIDFLQTCNSHMQQKLVCA